MPPLPEPDLAEEIALLHRLATGDRAALRALYPRYATALFSLALRLAGDRGAAEEIVQDTFLKIWHHAASYDARKSRPFTWAVTILRRTAIDHHRLHRREPLACPAPDPDATLARLATPETTRRAAESAETSARLHGALVDFPAPQRDALELALFSTLTHAEIAARLGQPAGTVKSWIRRGLLELRAQLAASPR